MMRKRKKLGKLCQSFAETPFEQYILYSPVSLCTKHQTPNLCNDRQRNRHILIMLRRVPDGEPAIKRAGEKNAIRPSVTPERISGPLLVGAITERRSRQRQTQNDSHAQPPPTHQTSRPQKMFNHLPLFLPPPCGARIQIVLQYLITSYTFY